MKILNSSRKVNDAGDISLRLTKLVKKQITTNVSKYRSFHGNVMCISSYSTENPRKSSRVIKFRSIVLHFVKRGEQRGWHIATFQ